MAENTPVRLSRFPWWFWGVVAGLFVTLVVAIAWFLRSPAFEQIVRDRVVAELEKITGGTVELQSLRWNLSKLEIEAEGLTVHGGEPKAELPLVHVDRLHLRLRIVSFLETTIDLAQLTLDQPVVHLIRGPDGSINLPQPKVKSTADPVQQLFALAIGRAELHNGALVFNDEKIPLDFTANDIGLEMNYRRLEPRYDGSLYLGKIDAQLPGLRDIPASAQAEFSLWRKGAQLRSLKLTSQKSAVDLSGVLDDFNSPNLQFSYAGTLDLVQAAAIARVPAVRGGGGSFSGSGALSRDNFSAAGKLSLRGVDYRNQSIALRDVDAASEFSVDRERIVLTKISARLLQGTLTGQAEVRHYAPGLEAGGAQASGQPAANRGKAMATANKQPAVPIQQGNADFRISGASLAEVLRLLASKSLPLDKLAAAGLVNGTVNLSWKESITRAVAELALDSIPQQPAGNRNQLPVSGTLRGRYDVRTATTQIATLSLATPHTEANASGTLGSRTADLKLGVTTSSLRELQPLLSALGEASLPVELNGRASFDGTLGGKLDHPDIAGRLLATDFYYVYSPAPPTPSPPGLINRVETALHLTEAPPEPKPQASPKRIHIDSFAGDLQYGRSQVALHNGVIVKGNANLIIDASATLENGSFTRNSPFQAKASIRNASVADLQATLGMSYPISGSANLTLQASGTASDPHGNGHFYVTGGEAYGHAIKTLTADLTLANHEVRLENIRLEALGGWLSGTAAFNINNHQMRSDLRAENIDLAQIRELQSVRLQERGTASFTLKVSGTPDQPVINAHLEVANIVVNDEFVGGLILDEVTYGNRMQLTGRSLFERASLTFEGTVELTGDMQSDLRLQFTQVDIDPLLLAELKTSITGHSTLSGKASISGPLRRPRALKGAMLIDGFTVELANIPIHTDGPIELGLEDEVVSVKRLAVMAEDTHLSFGGTIDLKGERPLDLYAKGHLNLALFHALDNEITSYGSTDADFTVRGTMDKPVMNGRVVVAHAGFSVMDLPASLSEVNGTMVFKQNRLEVESLSGRVGGGQVNFTGYITYGNGIAFDLKSEGTEIRFRYGGVSLTADQSLRLSGTLKNATLSGDITITRFAQITPVSVASSSFSPQTPQIINPRSPLNNLHFDVHIVSAPELTIQTSLAKLSGDADLRLRGTGTRPVLLGRISIAEGDINFNGQKYHLDRGDVTFANPVRIDPILDLEATTRVRDFDITIGLHGTMEKLTTTYRSDPPLSSDDIIALLAFGRTQEESYAAGGSGGSGGGSGLGAGAGSLVLGEALNQVVTNRVSKLFGVSSIRINPALGGADNNPSARLTVQQQVSNNVTLTYITNLTQSAQQVIQFEYNINEQYTFQAIRDENGVVSFDLLIRKRKK